MSCGSLAPTLRPSASAASAALRLSSLRWLRPVKKLPGLLDNEGAIGPEPRRSGESRAFRCTYLGGAGLDNGAAEVPA